MRKELDTSWVIDCTWAYETSWNIVRFGSPSATSGETARGGLEGKGCRTRSRGQPAIGERLEKAGWDAWRKSSGSGFQAATCAKLPAVARAAGRLKALPACWAPSVGLCHRFMDPGSGRGTRAAEVWDFVSSQPSGPAATYAGIFLPETATAKQGAKARRGFGVARETVADDKKGASEIKLAWCLSTNRASSFSLWCVARGPSGGGRQCSTSGTVATESASSRRWRFRLGAAACGCSSSFWHTTPAPKISSGSLTTCERNWAVSCMWCGTISGLTARLRSVWRRFNAIGPVSIASLPTLQNSIRSSTSGRRPNGAPWRMLLRQRSPRCAALSRTNSADSPGSSDPCKPTSAGPRSISFRVSSSRIDQ